MYIMELLAALLKPNLKNKKNPSRKKSLYFLRRKVFLNYGEMELLYFEKWNI